MFGKFLQPVIACLFCVSMVHASDVDVHAGADDLVLQIMQHLSTDDKGGMQTAGQHRTEIQFAELSYAYLQKNMFKEALTAVDGGLGFYPQSADLLSIKAETIAMIEDGSMEGEPFLLVQRALDINASHRHSLWLAAVANRQLGNYEASFLLLEKLKSRYEAGSESFSMVVETQSLLEKELGQEVVTSLKKESTDSIAESSLKDASTEKNSTYGTMEKGTPKSLYVAIDISESARQRFTDNSIVFVYAKSSENSRMPLAVAKTNLGSLPTTILLDDSMSMMPDISLNDAKSVTVGARISREGTALAFSGDWQDEAHGIELNGKVETNLYINTMVK